MLWTVFILLLALWTFGILTGYTLSNFIHLFLIAALVVLVVQLFSREPRQRE